MRLPDLPEMRTTAFALGALVMAQACSPDVEKPRAATTSRVTEIIKVAPVAIATTSEPEVRLVDPTDYSLCNPKVEGSIMADWKDRDGKPWQEPRRFEHGFPTTMHPQHFQQAREFMNGRGFYEDNFSNMRSPIATEIFKSTDRCRQAYLFFRKDAEGVNPDKEAALSCHLESNGANVLCHWDGYEKSGTADGWKDLVPDPLYVEPKRNKDKPVNPDVLKCAAQNAFPAGFKLTECH